MNFAVTAHDVRSVFGLTGVVHFPRYDAPHSRLNERTALFLSSIGLPNTEWFMARASLRTDDPIDLVSWHGSRGNVPGFYGKWLVLGLFADITLALDPEQGTVFALGEGEEELVYNPIHRDVESLVYALTKFEALRRQLENDDEETEERVDVLRGEITEFDPLPFADENSQWHLAFEEVIDGIW
ncbi:SUKH-4 family immunity protein [Streptomyces cyaneofuscatus]|uniref:SUKH-4 family immunity protein n=1 Tax=Streptomyces cyaneofuscatus TaxID=66883 RepID=UPI0037A461F2